jgi:TnpA family transposase
VASDQFSQYGSKPTIATMRDATYVLDAILDNESDLEITEHTTDTAGYTDIVFGLFDLLGLKFMPRLRDPGASRLYRIDKSIRYRHLGPLLRGTVRPSFILQRWDAMLRVTGSLKLGWVTSSLFLAKLHARERKTELASALEEYGRLVKTIFCCSTSTTRRCRSVSESSSTKAKRCTRCAASCSWQTRGRSVELRLRSR